MKIAPVVLAMAGHPTLTPVVVHSGQHAGMVRQALRPFGLDPDVELTFDRRTGSQAELVVRRSRVPVRGSPSSSLKRSPSSRAQTGPAPPTTR